MMDRKSFLRMGSIAAFGTLSWSDVLRLRAAAPKRDLSIIHLFLAGGLNQDNVVDAVAKVRPFGLDLCSGVRTNGALDSQKLEGIFEALVSAARI